jgi:hypothetical protein
MEFKSWFELFWFSGLRIDSVKSNLHLFYLFIHCLKLNLNRICFWLFWINLLKVKKQCVWYLPFNHFFSQYLKLLLNFYAKLSFLNMVFSLNTVYPHYLKWKTLLNKIMGNINLRAFHLILNRVKTCNQFIIKLIVAQV